MVFIIGFRHGKLMAALAMMIVSLSLMAQPYFFAQELANPLSLWKNTLSIKLAELFQLEPCFFQDEEPEPCSSEAED